MIAIVAGLLVWVGIAALSSFAARHGWPAYAAAQPTRAYDTPMRIARLAVGAIATVAGGAVAARIAQDAGRAALLTGGMLLLVSVPWHISIWPHYPVWYHLVYLAYLVPLALLGGRLARRGEN